MKHGLNVLLRGSSGVGKTTLAQNLGRRLYLDELAYLPRDARSGDLLYSIISRRHEKASTVITTNLAFEAWRTVSPGAPCVAALVDRFTQHCHVIDIDGDSWRQHEQDAAASTSAPTTRLAVTTKRKRPR